MLLEKYQKARNVALLAGCILCMGEVAPQQVAAQTKLHPSQMPPIAGAVQGTVVTNVLRDVNSAKDHGDGVFHGIGSAITDCGTVVSCSIIVPPSYTTTEAVPGYQLDPNNPPSAAGTPGNITIFDQRYGDARMAVNPTGYTSGTLSTPNGWIYDYYAKQQPSSILVPLYILQNSWDGGTNLQNNSLNYVNKTTYAPLSITNYSHTPGQHITLGVTTNSMSIGDSLGLANYVYCWGGFNAQADEGCEAQDNQVFQGSVEYAGTLTGTPVTGGSSVSVNPTQGLHTQGAGRFLIKMNAGTISAGAISAITTSTTAPTVLTGSGTNWPVSKLIATLGTNVAAPGTVTVTPSSFTVGTMAAITTSSLVCVADGGAFEMVTPSAVTSTSMTATFTRVHPASATIASGGVCGMLLDLTADDVTNSTFPNKLQTITGTLHFAWPAIASTSATSLQLFVAGGGAYQTLVTRWDAVAANQYVLYPMAEVVSVQQNGGLSDTLQLGPNNVAWAAQDSVAETLYPAGHFSFGASVVESYYPNFPAASGGFGITYNMPLQGNDTMLGLTNNAPVSMYKANGGKYDSPWGVHVSGQTRYGVFLDIPSDQWSFGVGCAAGCGSVINMLAAANSNYYDFLQYDEANYRWSITANSNAAKYTFGNTKFSTPFPNVYFAVDASNVGYAAAQSVRTATSANTDLAGELQFSAATSATYTMQGLYGSHAECWAEPQFDPGTNNRLWITYSGTTAFTVHYATAVTGTVSYGCMGRN
jgi:hypothetical protein